MSKTDILKRNPWRNQLLGPIFCTLAVLHTVLSPISAFAYEKWQTFSGPISHLPPAPGSLVINPLGQDLSSTSLSVAEELSETQAILTRTESLLGSSSDAFKLKNHYSSYLEALIKITQASPTPGLKISGNFKAALLAALHDTASIFPIPLGTSDLLNLLQKIELELKLGQLKPATTRTYTFTSEVKQSFQYSLHHHPDLHRILLQTRFQPIGRGANKLVYEVFDYPFFKRLALGLSLSSTQRDRFSLTAQARVFQKLSELSNSQGLVDTLYADHGSILQKAYTPVGVNTLLSYPYPVRLKLLEQVAEGLVHLHQAEICHGDIKEENLLLSMNGSEPQELVLTDFDLSYLPREMIENHQSRPLVGTFPILAPELLKAHLFPQAASWAGLPSSGAVEALHSKVQTALKADVFALATITSDLLRTDQKPWYADCEIKGRETELSDLWLCQRMHLNSYLKDLNRGEYNSLHQLLSAALDFYPLKRINSQTFLEGLRFIRKKTTLQRLNTSSKDSLEWIAPEMPIEKIEGAFLRSTPGEYVLNWHQRKKQPHQIRFSYLDKAGQFQTYLWNVDPEHPELIRQEVDFLKSLGKIQGDPIRLK